MKRWIENRFSLVGLVLVALVALFGVAEVSRLHAASAQGRAAAPQITWAPVVSTTVACPDPASGRGTVSRVGVVSPPGSRGSGRADLRPAAAPQSAPLASLTQPGSSWFGDGVVSGDALVVRAAGSVAGGLEADQTNVSLAPGPALSGVRCTEPGIGFWFVGPGPKQAGDLQLYLTNVDDGVASADVDVYSDTGPLDNLDAHGIVVQPHSRVVTSLRQTAGSSRLVALHVRTSMGRVAAAVRVLGAGGKGGDWLPVAVDPTTRLVVPGVPGGSGPRTLLVAAPGDTDADVQVQVVTDQGEYVPNGQGTLDVPAGSVTQMRLDQPLSGRAAAVVLTANVPVTAGLVAQSGGDVAFTAATPVLETRGVVAVNRSDGGYASTVLVSAPDRTDASVRVYAVSPRGSSVPRVFRVPAGRTVAVSVTPPLGVRGAYGIVISPLPGSGPVYAARVLALRSAAGMLFTIQPIVTARAWVPVPPAYEEFSAVVR